MTVCMAALGSSSRAIVCVSDKALSYEGYIQWDADSSKMLTLNPSGAVVLFAGGERDTSEVIARIIAIQEKLGSDRVATKKLIQKECQEAINESIERLYLSPRQLNRNEYVSAISGPQINPYIKSIAEEIHGFQLDCTFLVCGFDTRGAFILSVDGQGTVMDMTNTGFHAIGTGWEKAVSRLLFSEHARDHSIVRVLYDAFDAKVNAEMAPGVGYEWDARIVLGYKLGSHDVPKDIKKMVEKAWGKYSRSPFDKWNANEFEKGPPRDWKEQLDKFAASIMLKGYKERKG